MDTDWTQRGHWTQKVKYVFEYYSKFAVNCFYGFICPTSIDNFDSDYFADMLTLSV